MKVILIQDVEKLGSVGDLVTVKEGYARNFLLPKNLARAATPQNIKAAEAMKKKREAELAEKRQKALAFAKELSGVDLTIPMASGGEETLFGSVTAEIVAEALKAKDITIDPKDILLAEHIKTLGEYQVEVKVHPDAKALVKFKVVKKDEA